MKTSNNVELGKQQVLNFCKNIEIWFNGTASDPKLLYQAILHRFDPAFTLVNGDGDTIDFNQLSQWLEKVYGQFPTRKVVIQQLEGYATSQHILLTYTEIQYTEGLQNTRHASAVFVIREHQAFWYHLVEQWGN